MPYATRECVALSGFFKCCAIASVSLVTLATAGLARAEQGGEEFNWPTPVVHLEPEWAYSDVGILGVGAVVPPDARLRILRRTYTAEERRNVQTIIAEMSKPASAPSRRSKNFRPYRHNGFYVLHGAFGWPEKMGYSRYSFLGRVVYIEDIIAKGNRANVNFRITGPVSGPMYGFQGNGQLIDMRESLRYEFEEEGLIATYQPWSGEDLAFYEQLGGKLEFRKQSSESAAILAGRSITNAQPAATAADDLQSVIEREDYTASERKNIDTLRAAMSAPGGFDNPSARYFCKNYRNTNGSPWFTLDKMYGKKGGFDLRSVKNLQRQVTDVIAKGDRAWVHVLTSGVHAGPLFGVAPTGKTLKWNEEAYVTFDQDGKICATTRHPVQGELYLQLGGAFSFPYGEYWKCDGCPYMPGIAELQIPAEAR